MKSTRKKEIFLIINKINKNWLRNNNALKKQHINKTVHMHTRKWYSIVVLVYFVHKSKQKTNNNNNNNNNKTDMNMTNETWLKIINNTAKLRQY